MEHTGNLNPLYYYSVESGMKKYEVRRLEGKWGDISVGDYITFTNTGNTFEKVTVQVDEIIICDNFEAFRDAMINGDLNFKEVMPNKDNPNEVYDEYRKIYGNWTDQVLVFGIRVV